jgi:hypothetical protein
VSLHPGALGVIVETPGSEAARATNQQPDSEFTTMLNRMMIYGALLAPLALLAQARAEDLHSVLMSGKENTLQELANWTARQAGLAPAKSLPSIAFAVPDELKQLRDGGSLAQHGTGLIAIYDPRTKTILLSESWSGSTAAATSVIVHELVHHLQRESGKQYGCVQEQEEQAFAIQEAWLAEHGTSLEAEFGIDPFTRLVAALCPY